jgi:nucleotide-binding universal stress UspA family protein
VIVVGVDGSPGSDAALRWALAEAKLRGVALRAVTVYEPPQLPLAGPLAGAPGVLAPPAGTEEEVERARSALATTAQRVLDDALARLGDEARAGVTIESAPLEGSAAETLIDAGRDAELLVLGSRGRGGFVGLLLGSVSQQCAQHPPCPAVILPPPEDEGAGS